MTPTIGIIGALEKEVRQIYHEIEHGTVAEEAGLTIMGGEYHGFNLVATTAGMGTVNVAAAAQHLISRYGANALIFSGIAGGLNPALHIGDVVIGEHLRYIDTDTALIAESYPGLEEFTSSDFLVDLAEETLIAHGFVNAAPSPRATASSPAPSCVRPSSTPRRPIAPRWKAPPLRTSPLKTASTAWSCVPFRIIAMRSTTPSASASSIWMNMPAARAASPCRSCAVFRPSSA